MADPVAESIDFPEEEEGILRFWNEKEVFVRSVKLSEGKPRYTFYDGPPFATGLPHYGHILTGTIKDIVTRWAHQSGYHVERRFGWDCHGLPVEYEIDKALGIKGPEDVAGMGIGAYNDECRKIVMRYSSEWKMIIQRLGRWIDFENDYKTLYPWYMESIWWVFKQLFNKGMVYRGVKVMPFSTACNTPLSNFESGLNYKEVSDPAVTVSFPLVDHPDVSIVVWTTTPWTLPSNLAICVNPELDYVKVKENSSGKIFILMESRLSWMFKKATDFTVVERMKGVALKDKKYQPLFDYFQEWERRGGFRILCDSYVTEESGTGAVHQAPYFGEDDHRVCMSAGIITKESEMVCPIDDSGRFTDPVVHFVGMYIKDADKEIMKYLKKKGRVVLQSTIKHNYPFCWRSDTPLIYRAIPSWFIRVEQMTERLVQCNQSTYWVPEFVKEKRFGNWLRDARDWAVSRNRYWGTPIPLWISDDGQEILCVGSMKELEQLAGIKVTDIHRENVDQVTIPSKTGKGVLRRVPEVFDCWFESGSMPYAHVHYPFEKRKEFEDSFPADFIAEGVDQTRGWFYTLLVLSTALFDKPPFKNLIVNGLVLASDGQKMSKRKKNYPDPLQVVNKYGADALRLYLINSPVVRAENLRFREEGVRDVLKDVFLPWFNAYRFLVQNIHIYSKESGERFQFVDQNISIDRKGENSDPSKGKMSENLMDKWIESFTQSLVKFVREEMKKYRLYTVVPRLVKFVDNLTNWYVRMNRKRLKGSGGISDSRKALETLFSVLLQLVLVMSPFTPFLCELMYQNLKKLLLPGSELNQESVHHIMIPEVKEGIIDESVERRISRMQDVIEVGRLIRDRVTLPLKYPLPEVIVISRDQQVLTDVLSLQKYILEELNVRSLVVTSEREKFGVELKGIPDIKALGMRLKNESKKVIGGIKELREEELEEYERDPTGFRVAGERLEEGEMKIQYGLGKSGEKEKYEAHGVNGILVIMNIQADAEMMKEGIAREVVNRIQKLRKKGHLVPTDEITVWYRITKSEEIEKTVESMHEFISSSLKTPLKPLTALGDEKVIIREIQDLKDSQIEIVITGSKN